MSAKNRCFCNVSQQVLSEVLASLKRMKSRENVREVEKKNKNRASVVDRKVQAFNC